MGHPVKKVFPVLVVCLLLYLFFNSFSRDAVIYSLLLTPLLMALLSTAAPRPPRKKRRMSVLSTLLARGAFPDAVRAPDYAIHAALYMDRLPPREEVEALAHDILVNKHSLFSSVPLAVNQGLKKWDWEKADVHMSDHVISRTVEDDAALHALLEDLIPLPLSHSKPLWELHLIENRRGESCFLVRLSHTIGDGLALLQPLLQMTTDEKGVPLGIPAFLRRAPRTGPPPTLGERVVRIARTAALTAAAALKVLVLPLVGTDSPSPFKPAQWQYSGPGKYRLVRIPPIPIAKLKKVKETFGATINDVIVSVFAGALHRYAPEAAHMRALVPYAFPEGRRETLTNQWSFLSMTLPVAGDDAANRLRDTMAVLNRLKSTPEAYFQLLLSKLACVSLPVEQARQTAFGMFMRHSCVFTNVPGPQESMHVLGKRVNSVAAYLGNVLPQVCFVSYNGSLFGTVVVDAYVVPDADRLSTLVQEELNALLKA